VVNFPLTSPVALAWVGGGRWAWVRLWGSLAVAVAVARWRSPFGCCGVAGGTVGGWVAVVNCRANSQSVRTTEKIINKWNL